VTRAAEADDPRRRWLIKALAAGLFSAGQLMPARLGAQVAGGRPDKLPPGKSVFRSSGSATVNGKPVTDDTQIQAGDTLRTGKDSEIVFVVSDSSMLLRANSELVLAADGAAASSSRLVALKLVAGKVLAVFPPGPVTIQTAAANAQIRGTGVYVESDPERTYFCTCFGVTEVSAKDDPESRVTVTATHHNRPLYILTGAGNRGKSIQPAPFVNHTDQELALIEALVGRKLPASFAFPDKKYEPPGGRVYRN